MDLDDRLLRTSPGALAGGALVVALLPLLGLPAAPLAGDVALGVLSLVGLASAGWAWTRRQRLLSLPLIVSEVAARGLDGKLRIRVWLGHGRAMRDVRVVVRAQGAQAEVGAGGPVVGPWTAVVDVPGDRVQVEASCRSGGREWQAGAEVAVQPGRFAAPVSGKPGALQWARPQWDQVS
ncbi:MAG: hypothetical protein EP330_00585 [Deltaproteobacteria bacterium]|nr:MAG: hypothetical protein EP330_00585 [Deltaproteobacteria bacterium]